MEMTAPSLCSPLFVCELLPGWHACCHISQLRCIRHTSSCCRCHCLVFTSVGAVLQRSSCSMKLVGVDLAELTRPSKLTLDYFVPGTGVMKHSVTTLGTNHF